ncbi:MAG TPA: hypothetical protein VFN35_02175 [Ktedonobacteraceae bacterium]|nr:hypothetical protein [Ktedonobacteraceae bacterium]
MQTMDTSRSEIACLRQQIETQLIAMKRGLSGFSSGTARHAFISARMERIGVCQEHLTSQLGEAAADLLVYNLYNEIMDTSQG